MCFRVWGLGSSVGAEQESEEEEEEEEPAPAPKKAKTAAKSDAASAEDEGSSVSIFLKNLPWKASEDDIADFFKDCGEVTDVRLGAPFFSEFVHTKP